MTAVAVQSEEVVDRSRRAAAILGGTPTEEKNGLLDKLATALIDRAPELLEANQRDITAAINTGRRTALIDRLRLTRERIFATAQGVRAVARLEDPVGNMQAVSRRPNGMLVGRMRVPIGVILMIYEARPSVTVDAAALCLKAGNAVILRGGSESRHSNLALAALINDIGLPEGAVQVLDDPSRILLTDLLASDRIDVAIARGSEEMIRAVSKQARMPVLHHFKGVCHLFVDRDADLNLATEVVLNAKTQRPSTCNALETLLVDRAIAASFLPDAIQKLHGAGVEVRGCAETLGLSPWVVPAGESDWGTEFLDLILSVRVVTDAEEAATHIRQYGSGLADGIITNHHGRAMRFIQAVDSAAVLVNASTRLVDGAEFGLGSEIGISTSRIGPRGPMGLQELTTEKWVVLGSGQVR